MSMNLVFTLQIIQRLILRKPFPPPRISSISSDMDGFNNSNYSLEDLLKQEEEKEKLKLKSVNGSDANREGEKSR